ncbi:MAG: radical SAM protein [Candidatus Dormibacteria bacterium]
MELPGFEQPRGGFEQARLLELRRRTFDVSALRGIEFIEVEARTVINHVPGERLPFSWTINPYRGCSHACVYCFARATHWFLNLGAGRDFETKILVKVNVVEVLRAQLAARRWKGEQIAMGTNTDPYQAAEGQYRLMPGILRALIDFRNPFSILTKGTMLLRDLDLLCAAAQVTDVRTSYSIGSLDEHAWRLAEPRTPHPRKRLEAVAELNRSGIPCGVLMAPILPGINDDPETLKRTAEAAVMAGATHVYPILLHLRPRVKEVFMDWLGREFPGLVPRYEEMYGGGAYASAAQRRAVVVSVDGAAAEPRPGPARPRRDVPQSANPSARDSAEQLPLMETGTGGFGSGRSPNARQWARAPARGAAGQPP